MSAISLKVTSASKGGKSYLSFLINFVPNLVHHETLHRPMVENKGLSGKSQR